MSAGASFPWLEGVLCSRRSLYGSPSHHQKVGALRPAPHTPEARGLTVPGAQSRGPARLPACPSRLPGPGGQCAQLAPPAPGPQGVGGAQRPSSSSGPGVGLTYHSSRGRTGARPARGQLEKVSLTSDDTAPVRGRKTEAPLCCVRGGRAGWGPQMHRGQRGVRGAERGLAAALAAEGGLAEPEAQFRSTWSLLLVP